MTSENVDPEKILKEKPFALVKWFFILGMPCLVNGTIGLLATYVSLGNSFLVGTVLCLVACYVAVRRTLHGDMANLSRKLYLEARKELSIGISVGTILSACVFGFYLLLVFVLKASGLH